MSMMKAAASFQSECEENLRQKQKLFDTSFAFCNFYFCFVTVHLFNLSSYGKIFFDVFGIFTYYCYYELFNLSSFFLLWIWIYSDSCMNKNIFFKRFSGFANINNLAFDVCWIFPYFLYNKSLNFDDLTNAVSGYSNKHLLSIITAKKLFILISWIIYL